MVRLIPVALALVSLSFHDAWAATPTAELQAFFAETTRILSDPETDGKYAERLAAIRAITRQMLDVREAARLSLGPAWTERSEGERAEFALLYGDFLERAFIAWVASRAQIAGGPRVTFLGESVNGGLAVVRTTVVGRNGGDLPLEYRMLQRGNRWAVFDVVIDGVSLAANYRAQFTRVIQASSYQDLVQQLRDRVRPAPPIAAASEPFASPVAAAPVAREPLASVPPVAAPPLTTPPPVEPRVERGRSRATIAARGSADRSRPRPYWVQVAAFKSFETAARLVSTLRAAPAPARWAVVTATGPDLARVRVGPFADRAEAASSVRALESRGFKPFITKERRGLP
jgi:phospholipid transport system substrate-binding protein